MKKLLASFGLVSWVAAASCGGASTSGEHGGGARGGALNAAGQGGSADLGAVAGRGGAVGEDGGASGVPGRDTGGAAGRVNTGGTSGGRGATGGTGVVTSSGCAVEPAALDGLTFEANLTGATDDDGYVPVTTVFHFVNGPSGLEVVIGNDGHATRATVDVRGDKLELGGDLEIRDLSGARPWSDANGTFIQNLELCAEPPRDSSGRLRGKGTLLVIANSDDDEDQWDQAIDFDAGVDTRAPSLPAEVTLNPLEPSLIRLSEPAALGATLRLSAPPEPTLEPVVMAGTVVGFQAALVLPLGLDSTVSASAHDLAGLKLVSDLRVSTNADPGVQAQDGFESELHVTDYGYGQAELVRDGRALEGSASLFLSAGADTVLHLKRPSPSAKTLRFELLPVLSVFQIPANIVVRAGVIFGTKIDSLMIPLSPEDYLVDGALGEAGAGGGGAGSGSAQPIAVELELSETGDDILVSIATPFIEESASTVVGAVIDQLRIE